MVWMVYIRGRHYEGGPVPLWTTAGVACLCDEARGRVYKGGPLPLWTTRRHHIITKEKHTQSYLVVTYSRRPVRHARSWPEWNCHLGGSSQLLEAKAPWTCLYSIIQHHLGSLQDPPLHKNCFMLSLHENKFFGFEWEWPCRCQLPSEVGCSFGRAWSV